MDGLARAVGDGLVGLWANAFEAIGAALRGAWNQLLLTVPGPLLAVIGFVALVSLAWVLARR
jgi:hypothetical protein